MASFHWASDVSGDFNNAANWVDQNHNPGVPGPNDTATISYSGVTVTSSQSNTVGSLSDSGAISLTGGTFAVATNSSLAQLTVAAGAAFEVSGGTTTLSGGSAHSVLSSTVSVASGATLDLAGNTVDLNSGAALEGAGEYLFGDATVNVNTPLVAPADLELKGGAGGRGATDRAQHGHGAHPHQLQPRRADARQYRHRAAWPGRQRHP